MKFQFNFVKWLLLTFHSNFCEVITCQLVSVF